MPYGGGSYGGSSGTPTYVGADSWTISDQDATRVSGTDSWTVSDVAPAIIAQPRLAADSWSIADGTPTGRSAFARSAADGWSVADAAIDQITYVRSAADSWSLSDSATSQFLAGRRGDDAWSISDAAPRQATYQRSAQDSFTVADGPARVFWAPYVDLPTHFALRGEPAGLVVDPATHKLVLQRGGTLQLSPERTGLAIQSVPTKLALDPRKAGITLDG